ncbi:MAG: recombinase family protein [bacterium]|nr:recombinase family protein [bacterium]
MTKRITIYARVSTKEQNVEMQLRDLRRYAKDREPIIIRVDVKQDALLSWGVLSTMQPMPS